MTTNNELIERLRHIASKGVSVWGDLQMEAADALETQARQIDALKEDAEQDEALIRQMLKAINAMLTHMGMDEDDWNKPTFDQCRASENAARARLGGVGTT